MKSEHIQSEGEKRESQNDLHTASLKLFINEYWK